MRRTPDELLAEIATWPLADRLRLAARILEDAARLAQAQDGGPRTATSGDGTARAGPHAVVRPAPPAASPHERSVGERPPSHSGKSRPSDDGRSSASQWSGAAPGITEVRELLVLDGSNFLGTVPGYDLSSEASREELVTRLQDYAHMHPAIRIVVYFDGQKTSVKRVGGVEVRFTQRGRPADFFILEMLGGLAEAQRHKSLLVTGDRALADAARKLGAKVEATSSFHRRLPGPKRTAVGQRGLNAAEVADWEEYFSRPPERGGQPPKR